jgi:hypothetical protein
MTGVADRTGRVVCLSGPVAVGKTTLARLLANRSGDHRISTRDLLLSYAGRCGAEVAPHRRDLQEYGVVVEESTNGRWIASAAMGVLGERPDVELLVLDAVRLPGQVAWLREIFGGRLSHVHLRAPYPVLVGRYDSRGEGSGLAELSSYAEVATHPVEGVVRQLASAADLVVETGSRNAAEVRAWVGAALGL